MLKFDEVPSTPEADRIMVQPEQPRTETDGRLVIPEIAQRQAFVGKILDAGLKARDVLYDNGGRVGDTIWYGQFAGVWEEWDHIVKVGSKADCAHPAWSYEPSLNGFRRQGYHCDECGALRVQEPILIMNVGDIVANVSKAERIRNREQTAILGATMDGKTQHFFQHGPGPSPTLTTNGVTHAS